MNSDKIAAGMLLRYGTGETDLIWVVNISTFGHLVGLRCQGNYKNFRSDDVQPASDADVELWCRFERERNLLAFRTEFAASHGVTYVTPTVPDRRIAPEPEHARTDGTTRKDHYGAGKQPWDFIVEAGWGAAFAAGNTFKYMRREKEITDSRIKAGWYWRELNALVIRSERDGFTGDTVVLMALQNLLTESERVFLSFFIGMTDAEMREALATGRVTLPA